MVRASLARALVERLEVSLARAPRHLGEPTPEISKVPPETGQEANEGNNVPPHEGNNIPHCVPQYRE